MASVHRHGAERVVRAAMRARSADINVIPLINVLLILIVVFIAIYLAALPPMV